MIIPYIEHLDRRYQHSLLETFNAVLYVFKTGYQRRMLPGDFLGETLPTITSESRKKALLKIIVFSC